MSDHFGKLCIKELSWRFQTAQLANTAQFQKKNTTEQHP